MAKVIAVVPGAGAGRRLGPGTNKPFQTLIDRPLIVWTLQRLQASEEISEIIPVLRGADIAEGMRLFSAYRLSKVMRVAEGGAERQDSVYSGLKLIKNASSIVFIHDGARPLLPGSLIRDAISGLKGFDGAVAGLPLKDTVKKTDKGGVVRETLNRHALRAVQTPQVFRFRTIMEAYERAMREGFYSTDDSALVEKLGGRVRVVEGSYMNIKITTPEDLHAAEMFIKKGKS